MPGDPQTTCIHAIISAVSQEASQLNSSPPRARLAAADDVTEVQFRVLVVLDVHGPLRTNELASELGIEPAVVAGLCGRLLSGGFVHRFQRVSAAPHRTVCVALTDLGRARASWVEHRRRSA